MRFMNRAESCLSLLHYPGLLNLEFFVRRGCANLVLDTITLVFFNTLGYKLRFALSLSLSIPLYDWVDYTIYNEFPPLSLVFLKPLFPELFPFSSYEKNTEMKAWMPRWPLIKETWMDQLNWLEVWQFFLFFLGGIRELHTIKLE